MKARKLIRTMAALVCAASVSAAGACSTPLGLPTRGDVTTLAPIERQDRRVYTVPDGPEADAQPESVVEGFFAAMPAGVSSAEARCRRGRPRCSFRVHREKDP